MFFDKRLDLLSSMVLLFSFLQKLCNAQTANKHKENIINNFKYVILFVCSDILSNFSNSVTCENLLNHLLLVGVVLLVSFSYRMIF